MNKRILAISTVPFTINGMTMIISNYYNHFKNIKNDIDFAVPREVDYKYKEKLENDGAHVYVLPDRKKKFLKYLVDINNLIKKYDVIFINGNSVTMIIEAFIAKSNGKKVVTLTHNTHTDHPQFQKLFKNYFNKKIDKKLAVSKDAGNQIYNGNFTTIENGIDTYKFRFNKKKRDTIRKEHSLTDDDIVLICVGIVGDTKNQEYLIDILKKLNPKYKLLIIGDGEERNNIEKDFNANGLRQRVIFTGNVDNVYDYLSASDIFVNPSKFEGSSLVTIEAQCNGLPGIVSYGVPATTIVSPYMEMIHLNDKPEWVKSIKNISLNNNKVRESGQKMIISQGFDIDDESIKLENIIENLM